MVWLPYHISRADIINRSCTHSCWAWAQTGKPGTRYGGGWDVDFKWRGILEEASVKLLENVWPWKSRCGAFSCATVKPLVQRLQEQFLLHMCSVHRHRRGVIGITTRLRKRMPGQDSAMDSDIGHHSGILELYQLQSWAMIASSVSSKQDEETLPWV